MFLVDCKSNLPTSRLARKRLAAKGFGAGGVAPTPPVNLPCRPSFGHPKSVIRNRITHSRDGLHCPSASRKLPLETTHSWSEFVSPEHEKAREVPREVTREVWREVNNRISLWYTILYKAQREVFCKNNQSTHSRVKRNRRDRRTFLKTNGTDERKICCFSHSIIAQSIRPFSPLFSPLSPLSPRKTDGTDELVWRPKGQANRRKKGIKEGRRHACAPPVIISLYWE